MGWLKSGLAKIGKLLAWLAVWRVLAKPGLAGVACCLTIWLAAVLVLWIGLSE
jgi:hypothetical protein